eukprot:scaffold322600_cov26-Tisochrysis_lutea.AAC.1
MLIHHHADLSSLYLRVVIVVLRAENPGRSQPSQLEAAGLAENFPAVGGLICIGEERTVSLSNVRCSSPQFEAASLQRRLSSDLSDLSAPPSPQRTASKQTDVNNFLF